MLYTALRAMRTGNLPAARAPLLIMQFDNAADQKCNVLLAFISDLVNHGWYLQCYYFCFYFEVMVCAQVC